MRLYWPPLLSFYLFFLFLIQPTSTPISDQTKYLAGLHLLVLHTRTPTLRPSPSNGRGGRSICTFTHIIELSSACWFFLPHFLSLKSLHPLIIVTIRYAFSFFFFFYLISVLFLLVLAPHLCCPLLSVCTLLSHPTKLFPEPSSLRPITISSHLHFSFKFSYYSK